MDRWLTRIGCGVLAISLLWLLLASDLFQMTFWQWAPQGLSIRMSEHAFLRLAPPSADSNLSECIVAVFALIGVALLVTGRCLRTRS